MWGHMDHGFESWSLKYHKWWPGLTEFIVTRDPIATLGTFWRTYNEYDKHGQQRLGQNMVNDLGKYVLYQNRFVAAHRPYVHRVEDPIQSLGNWAGVELKSGGNRHSGKTVLREAIEARDVGTICSLMPVKFWDWFTTSHSANMVPLYRDTWGYDFWWYNQ